MIAVLDFEKKFQLLAGEFFDSGLHPQTQLIEPLHIRAD
jgi:hypothetical protein